MENTLVIVLQIALVLIFASAVYDYIILPFIKLKYKVKHTEIIKELKNYQSKDEKDEKALKLLNELLQSHSRMIEHDNLRLHFDFMRKIKNDPAFKSKVYHEVSKNRAILDNAHNDLRNLFNRSVELAKTSFIYNSLIDILVLLFALVLLLIIWLPALIIMGFLGKSFNKLKQFSENSNNVTLIHS